MRFKGIDKYTKAAERTSGLVLTYSGTSANEDHSFRNDIR